MRLLLEVPSANVPLRVFVDGANLWITINASWVGTQWKATFTGKSRAAMRLGEKDVEFLFHPAVAGTWSSWDRAVSLTLGATNLELVSSGASGIQQRTYTGGEGLHNGSSAIGGVWNYPIRFATPPSSITFLQTSKWPAFWSLEPFVWQHDETGGTWSGLPGGSVTDAAWFTAKVTAY